jgi:hypothetical protein
MKEVDTHRAIYTLLKFDIQGIIDVCKQGEVRTLTSKSEIEDHRLTFNPKAHWTAGETTFFGPKKMWRQLGVTGDLELSINS